MASFTKGQLVWAKVKGYSWWPAEVLQSYVSDNDGKEIEIEVNFIGDYTYAILTLDNIADYESHFAKYSKIKSKKLQEAIKIAETMCNRAQKIEGEPVKVEENTRRRTRAQKPKQEASTGGTFWEQINPSSRSQTRNQRNPPSKKASKPQKTKEFHMQRIDRYPSPQERDYGAAESFQPPKVEEVQPKRKTHNVSFAPQSPIQAAAGILRNKNYSSVRKSNKEQQNLIVLTTNYKPSMGRIGYSLDKNRINLLSNIRAEPKSTSRIEVTTKKDNKKLIKSLIPNLNKIGNNLNNKRSSLWLEDVPSSVYIGHAPPKELREAGAEIITKKIHSSPTFQQKMVSVKGTKIQNLQNGDDNISKALMAYNCLMMKKFENDLAHLLQKLVSKFKNKEDLHENDTDASKLLNILNELEKNKFNGPEFISSDVGKLLKTLHALIINNRNSQNHIGNHIVSAIENSIQRVKEKIVAFCLDNKDYTQAFAIPETEENMNKTKAEIKTLEEKQEERQEEKQEGTPKFKNLTNYDEPKENKKEFIHEDIKVKMMSGKKEEEPTKIKVEPVKKLFEEKDENQKLLLTDRRRICIDIATLLQESFNMTLSKAREISLSVEDTINKYYASSKVEYLEASKTICELVQSKKITLDELISYKDMKNSSFKRNIRRNSKQMVSDVKENMIEIEATPERPHKNFILLQTTDKKSNDFRRFR